MGIRKQRISSLKNEDFEFQIAFQSAHSTPERR